MKKIFSVILLSSFFSVSYAAHGPAGCGLGAMVLGDKKGLVFNVLAATTNGTSGNQTFGMSTGTLGCEDASTAMVAAVYFIQNNRVSLSNDIANGNGKTLDAYLVLINKKNANKSLLKENFAKIFSTESADSIHKNIIGLI